jgi:hypothetical protein
MARFEVQRSAPPASFLGQPQAAANIIDGAPDLICEQEAPGNEPCTGYLDVELAERHNLVEMGWPVGALRIRTRRRGEVVISDPHYP